MFRVLVVPTRSLHQKMIGQETRLRCFLILNHVRLEQSIVYGFYFFVQSYPSYQVHQLQESEKGQIFY